MEDNNNFYSSPQSQIIDAEQQHQAALASRWARLGASLIDTIIMMLFLFPLMFMTDEWDGIQQGIEPSLTYNIMIAIAGIVIFAVINGVLLARYGQTVGKRLLKIKITDMNGQRPTMNNYIVRYAVYFLPGQIPVVGQIFSLVNALFIFGNSKRCLHDHAGGTKVVNC